MAPDIEAVRELVSNGDIWRAAEPFLRLADPAADLNAEGGAARDATNARL